MKVNFHLDKKNKPQSENGMKVVYGQAKRGGYRIRWYLILLLVISPIIFMAYYLFQSKLLVTAPGIVTSYPITLTSTQAANVGQISTQVGTEVNTDESLLLLSDPALNAEITYLNQEIEKLKGNVDDNTNALYQTMIAETKASLYRVTQIQKKYDENRRKGLVSDADYAAIINVSNGLNTQLSEQKIAYLDAQTERKQVNLAGPISQAQRSLMQELVVKKVQQDNLTYLAPFTGRVLDIHVHEGQRVTDNYPLVTLARNITPEVTAFLNPKHLKYSQLGTSARIIFPDGAVFSAQVSRPVEVVNKLPTELQSPFEGQAAYLKVTLSFNEPLEKTRWIEGVNVEVDFSFAASFKWFDSNINSMPSQ
ncbi:HlyD family secretion protein [Vibrio taketomensis]|uniref:HlyD family secretion protein n=1 Tax=Vibrio taketomensis TaxID=2572923 RepID=UPI0013895A8B|nr:HlyD family secretion protein [Vibrio taketomensis]